MVKYLDKVPHPWTRDDIRIAMFTKFTDVSLSIDETKGGRLWCSLKELDDTIWIFCTSTAELIDEICIFNERTKEPQFWGKTNEKNADRYVIEIKRKLYYCTSAAMTLVDISRNFSKKWPIEGFIDKRAEIFCVPGLHDFIQGLRNYSTHWRIAEANWQIDYNYGPGNRLAKFICTKEELLAWGKWNRNSRAYIENSEKHVDIFKVFTKYKKQVQDYYSWQKGILLDKYAPILQPYFEYKKLHEGLEKYYNWNMILSHIPSNLNPYQYLAQYLDSTQIELLLSYEHRSEQQINALIRILNMEDFCDNNLRQKISAAFKPSNPTPDTAD